ncbi:MAG: gas vesicle protein GvpO [bacterium]|nr:gas vesicle protein GvpO [bacterium]
MSKMAITADKVIEGAKEQLSALIDRKPSGVVAVSRDEKGWHVSLEMLEKTSIPDGMDLLAIYETLLDDEGKLVKFDRKQLRHRGDVEKTYEEE